MTDPPIHTRLRKVIARAFSARRFMNIRAALASTANEYLERLADEGAAGKSVDFVQIVAKPFSAAVHAEYLLGIPREHYAALLPLMDAWFSGVEPNANASDVLQADEAVRILTETCRVLLGEHRHRRDETLISILASDPQLEDDERIPNLFILLSAYITTCHAIGNGVVTLLKTPRAARELRARPELAPTAVEELIRICPSIRLRSRAARVDTDLHGVKVPAGTAVLLWLEAANRDPTVFTNPNRLNLARRPNPHLSFGGANIHACLGGMLARLELETLLPTLLRRFEGLHLSAEPVGIPGTQVSGYSSIPLSLGLSRRVSR
jgi:cytochrome P450